MSSFLSAGLRQALLYNLLVPFQFHQCIYSGLSDAMLNKLWESDYYQKMNCKEIGFEVCSVQNKCH